MNDYDYSAANLGQVEGLGWAQGPGESGLYENSPYGYQSGSQFGVLRPLQKLGWYESQASVRREAMGRVVIVGAAGVGKRRLLARLRGWTPKSTPQSVEDWGFWTVVDLPIEEGEWMSSTSAWDQVRRADLVLFVTSGLAEIRFLSRLRASGQPLVVVGMGPDARLLAQRMGQEVICVDTSCPETLEQLLIQIITVNPALLVPLGRELPLWRRQLAKRLVHETALMCGLTGLEPQAFMNGLAGLEPMGLSVPLSVMAQTRLTLSVLAMYGHHSPSPMRRETLMLVGSCLLVRAACKQALSMTSAGAIFQSLLTGVASATGTWLLGWLLVLSLEPERYEALL